MIRARYGKFTRVANEFSLRHPSASKLSSPSLQINLDATLRATSSVTDCAALYRFARSSPVHLWRKTHDARIPRSNVSSNGEQRARLINGPRYAFAYTRIRLRTAMAIKRERGRHTRGSHAFSLPAIEHAIEGIPAVTGTRKTSFCIFFSYYTRQTGEEGIRKIRF